MARFARLPNEVLLDIFRRLPFIDDANHLARCSKNFNQIFEQNRLAIFKAIIITFDYHKFDIRLCKLIKVNFDFATQHGHWLSSGITNYSEGPHADCRPPPSVYQSCTPVGKEQMTGAEMDAMLTPDVVWDIVARWAAMQLLSKIYVSRLVKERFVEGTVGGPWAATWPDNEGNFEANNHEDQPAYPGDIGIVDCLPFQQDLLTRNVRSRFYRSVMAIWVMQEACQLLRMTRWDTTIQLQRAERELRNFSICTTVHSIQEDVDALEVIDFLRDWCIPRIFASFGKLRQCVFGEDNLTLNFTHNSLSTYWFVHMKVMKRILRPSDVLELLVMSANGLQRLCPNQQYLRIRGAFEKAQYFKYWPSQLGFDLEE